MPTYEPRDKFYRKARAMGLPSRAAFKIEELIDRAKLALPGSRIVDLGCAPGGWLAILARAVGPGGRVVGVDLAPVKSPAPCCVTLCGDIRDPEVVASAIDALGAHADLVTCDIAPKLTGVRDRDEARMRELIDAAIAFATRALKPGGAMIAKAFMSRGFKEIVAEFEELFANVEVTRVRASRPGSSELYIVARGFKRAGRSPARGTAS
jgi:23S rRNA (uridine2552-2'-O)-methyltransferase